MRVIAGSMRGMRLKAPKGARPTTDRVREALFSALGNDAVVEASVLDLFAGSGALAIEALSRGATSAVLVDLDRAAVGVCRANLERADAGRVQATSVHAFLTASPPTEAPFDLVFLDPPYETADDEVDGVLERLAEPGWCSPQAVAVVERSARSTLPGVWAAPPRWGVSWERRYGDTLVVILRATE